VILFFKSDVAGYTRRDGVVVSAHFRRADKYAENAHKGQYRKGKPGAARIEYIEHPRAVARILHDEAGVTDLATLQAALLHDTMEDCGVSHENLVVEFGHDVADAVRELTNDQVEPGGKLAMQVAHARKMSPRAAAVKVADKTANLRDLLATPPDWPTDRVRKYYGDARVVVQAMGTRHKVLEDIFDDIYFRGIATI
jgi:guanosine-3',5'-bis(diphosphate) 3'-pyrophosphohydrolase